MKVTERFIPLNGDRADDARDDLLRIEREYADKPNVRVAGMVETRSLAHKTPHTTAKWCAVIREATGGGGVMDAPHTPAQALLQAEMLAADLAADLSAALTQVAQAVELLRDVVKSDKWDARHGGTVAGDSALGATISLGILPFLASSDVPASGEPTDG